VLAIVVVVAQAIPYLSQARIRESQSAAARGDLAGALASARGARQVQPWGPGPWLQLALVYELRGELEQARTAIERATHEDRDDWRLWLVAARLETKLGLIDEGRRSLRRAIRLNPRSPLLENLR
jgi:Flp pilus assembly protein TadD